MTPNILRQHTEPYDREGLHQIQHTILDVPGLGPIYEVAGPFGRVERHDVWSDTEIADILETDDGPFDLWEHDWTVIAVGLVVVHVLDQDWYVLPEAWRADDR